MGGKYSNLNHLITLIVDIPKFITVFEWISSKTVQILSFHRIDKLIYCRSISECMAIAMSEFLILIGCGIVYLGALVAYNKFGKKAE